jgi:hypothetical protein
LPAWLAVIEHMPTDTIVTVFPDTVQTGVVVEVKLTVRPEVAVALIANGATPKLTLEGALKVIVCDAGFTVKLWVTVGAAAYVAFPG